MLKLMEPDIANNTKRAVELNKKIDSLMSYKWDPSLFRTLALVEASHGATNVLWPPKDILRLKTEMRDVLQEATDSGKMKTMLDEFPGYSVWCDGFGLGGAP